MRQHRDQLAIYISSLQRALNSLDRLTSLETTHNETNLVNSKQYIRKFHRKESNFPSVLKT